MLLTPGFRFRVVRNLSCGFWFSSRSQIMWNRLFISLLNIITTWSSLSRYSHNVNIYLSRLCFIVSAAGPVSSFPTTAPAPPSCYSDFPPQPAFPASLRAFSAAGPVSVCLARSRRSTASRCPPRGWTPPARVCAASPLSARPGSLGVGRVYGASRPRAQPPAAPTAIGQLDICEVGLCLWVCL